MNRFKSFFIALLGLGADVISVTSGTVGVTGNVAADLITFMSASLLEVAELNTVLDQFGEKRPLPSNSSLTIRFVREEKLAVSATPTQLTQGIPPDALGIALNQFEATMEQYRSCCSKILSNIPGKLNGNSSFRDLNTKRSYSAC